MWQDHVRESQICDAGGGRSNVSDVVASVWIADDSGVDFPDVLKTQERQKGTRSYAAVVIRTRAAKVGKLLKAKREVVDSRVVETEQGGVRNTDFVGNSNPESVRPGQVMQE